MKNRNGARLFDLTKANHHEVIQALKRAIDEADRDVDGVIITLASNNGRKARSIIAGSLKKTPMASFETFRLQLSLAWNDEHE